MFRRMITRFLWMTSLHALGPTSQWYDYRFSCIDKYYYCRLLQINPAIIIRIFVGQWTVYNIQLVRNLVTFIGLAAVIVFTYADLYMDTVAADAEPYCTLLYPLSLYIV